MTYKQVYYLVWCQVLDIMLKGDHKNMNGLLTIISLKALFKTSLSPKLKLAFPNLILAKLPKYSLNLNLINIQWLAGFIYALI